MNVHTEPGVSGSLFAFTLTGGRDGEPRPAGHASQSLERAEATQRSSGVGAAMSIVPEGDASEQVPATVQARRRDVRGRSNPDEALPAHEARRVGRRAREDACIETGRLKRMAANTPITLLGPNHANGWTEMGGDILTER